MNRIDPYFREKLKPFGIGNWNDCYHCGNCTAICPHTENGFLFPRKSIRNMQLGLTNRIHTNVDPWLCYYCGDCSETCPRNANPGELMMTLRRYLTTVYDWTGLSRILYTSVPALIIAFLLVALSIVGVAFVKNFEIDSTMEFGHKFEFIAILSVAVAILLPNILRMIWFTLVKEKVKAPLFFYITGFVDLIIHMFTQKKSLKCEKNTLLWFGHFLLVLGYLMLLFTTVFLNWFSTENLYIIITGYVVGAITFVITFLYIIRRFRKKKEISKFSHYSDWLFVVWLFLMGLTAFLVRVCIDTHTIGNYFWLYLSHLIILAQWAVLIVPFGKWTHFLYRSFAIYIAKIKKEMLLKQTEKELVTIAT
jgi:ferredoxin